MAELFTAQDEPIKVLDISSKTGHSRWSVRKAYRRLRECMPDAVHLMPLDGRREYLLNSLTANKIAAILRRKEPILK